MPGGEDVPLSLLVPERAPELQELLEDPAQPEALVRGSYGDLRRINRWLGGLGGLRRDLPELLRGAGRDVRVLDIATGSGDVLQEAGRICRETGRRPRLLGLDRHTGALRMARDLAGEDLRLLRADAVRLPLRDGSVDVALCHLTAHHLGRAGAVRLVAEMERVSRHGWILNDLRRHRVAWIAIKVLTRIFTDNPLTRWDGPVSVLRAFTTEEMAEIVEEAGCGAVELDRRWAFRLRVLRRKSGARP